MHKRNRTSHQSGSKRSYKRSTSWACFFVSAQVMSDQAFVSRRMKSRRHRLAGGSVTEGSLWRTVTLQQSSPVKPAATRSGTFVCNLALYCLQWVALDSTFTAWNWSWAFYNQPAAVFPQWHCIRIEQWLSSAAYCVYVCEGERDMRATVFVVVDATTLRHNN